ncbi:MAG TPA: peptidase E [Planctomycetaceae bacterium]|jgi:peptidase E
MTTDVRKILAIGGLYSDEGDNRPLMQYLLDLAGKPHPAIGFIPTASGDAPSTIQRIDEIFSTLDCRLTRLEFFDRTPNVQSFVAAQDVILVGGGNTKSMLAVWREWGLAEILREAWHSGKVLAGWSAGAICWFEQGLTDSFADRLRPMECLGLLSGSCSPHYDRESDRRPAYHDLIREGLLQPGIGIEDGCAVEFHDREVHRLIAPASSVGAWAVRPGQSGGEEEIVERALIAERIEI